jgi:hypothetical protein
LHVLNRGAVALIAGDIRRKVAGRDLLGLHTGVANVTLTVPARLFFSLHLRPQSPRKTANQHKSQADSHKHPAQNTRINSALQTHCFSPYCYQKVRLLQNCRLGVGWASAHHFDGANLTLPRKNRSFDFAQDGEPVEPLLIFSFRW